jgi:antitoxin component YwqK of YwqJK toxin-antitoxin module
MNGRFSMAQLPRLSRVSFFMLNEADFVFAVADAIRAFIQENSQDSLTPAHSAIVAWSTLAIDVPNGGFTQFYFNHRGDRGVNELADLLDEMEIPQAPMLFRATNSLYAKHKKKFDVENPWDGLFGSIPELELFDSEFADIEMRCHRAVEKWIRRNIAGFIHDEAGSAIDPQFSGVVEIFQPNGRLSQTLEVQNGRPHGAHRTYFDDGSIRRAEHYKSGKKTGDYWPSGQLKRRELVDGELTNIEWYFPSGAIQKRYTKDKQGNAVGVVELYHENGKISESLSVSDGKELGPWLKYFPDGSPKLKAEYLADSTLVVHEAWNDQGNRLVKDGSGEFYDDGASINWPYDVTFTHMWQRRFQLLHGIPHGESITYSNGVLWSTTNYDNGKEFGERKLYWDNGRVRSIQQLVNEKTISEQNFPKFDNPVPAVVLSLEANERLYRAWDHLLLDEYPQSHNLEEVQQQLRVPDFLKEVHERNQSGTIKSDYEDANSFDQTIAHFLTIDEQGVVVEAVTNGASPYAGAVWDAYLPLLKQLHFTPGRLRGKAMQCRVLAVVSHTFMEGGEGSP